jgi:hypothetical protein
VRFLSTRPTLLCEYGHCGKSCEDAIFMCDDQMYCSESCRTLAKCATATRKASGQARRGKVGMGFARRPSQSSLIAMASVCETVAFK